MDKLNILKADDITTTRDDNIDLDSGYVPVGQAVKFILILGGTVIFEKFELVMSCSKLSQHLK